ncbi:GCN5-related N-acetyltransferase [alpha proteobacterium BAL199]|jgi:ribosomal protein S18 acetylase RimI-like enzyme|nr:GCN5-related N-acetyltransferase [alpha proteobacterium BAL199]
MTVIVRPMVVGDASEVARMAAALSAHEGAAPPPFDAATIERWAFGPDRRFDGLVAMADNRHVGYALFHDAFHVGQGAPGLFLMDLYTDPVARRQGVGRALVDAVAAIARERDGTWVVWQAHPDNVEALAFYRSIGGRRYRAADFELLVGP